MGSVKVLFNSKTILLDIEGTTTSIKFVKEVLYSCARQNLREYIYENWEVDQLKEIVQLIKKQYQEDLVNNYEGVVPIEVGKQEKESIVENLLWQMDLDRKTYALKKLQGLIWREKYTSGELKGHIYDDVVPALEKCIESGIKLYVFSSGSVEAQLLHFKYSEKGNLLKLFSGHFDTSFGSKVEASSYWKIAEHIGKPPGEILFITDVIKEAEAAAQAGYEVIISERPGNAPVDEHYRCQFKFIQSFDQLFQSAL